MISCASFQPEHIEISTSLSMSRVFVRYINYLVKALCETCCLRVVLNRMGKVIISYIFHLTLKNAVLMWNISNSVIIALVIRYIVKMVLPPSQKTTWDRNLECIAWSFKVFWIESVGIWIFIWFHPLGISILPFIGCLVKFLLDLTCWNQEFDV